MGGQAFAPAYASLPALVELKIAAGRISDEHDVVELILANRDQVDLVSRHLAEIHSDYVRAFEALLARATCSR